MKKPRRSHGTTFWRYIMTRSSRFFSVLAAACLAAASAFSATADRVVSALSYGIVRLLVAWVEPFKPQVKPPSQEKPRVALVAARSFIARLMRRERPTVTTRWRMCPSG